MAGLIIHEWAEMSGGAEQVVDQFVAEFPDADLQVIWNDATERYPQARETWIARTPLRRSKPLALPFMPVTWRVLPAPKHYDWALVSSHLFAHHARLRGPDSPPKLVYAHTPARYIWSPELDDRGRSVVARVGSAVLRPLDRRRSAEALSIVTNSQFTRSRIQRAWGRDASVIYPPVDVESIRSQSDWRTTLTASEDATVASLPNPFLLGASRFVPYKRLDLVIRLGEASGLPVVLAGRGPDESRLRALATASSVPVAFVISPSDNMLRALYQQAMAFVFPAIEDFGIMPIEAMAAGTPVIVASHGGAAESAHITGGGVVLADESAAGLASAVERVQSIDRRQLPASVGRFSVSRFRGEIRSWVEGELRGSV